MLQWPRCTTRAAAVDCQADRIGYKALRSSCTGLHDWSGFHRIQGPPEQLHWRCVCLGAIRSHTLVIRSLTIPFEALVSVLALGLEVTNIHSPRVNVSPSIAEGTHGEAGQGASFRIEEQARREPYAPSEQRAYDGSPS